MKVVLFCGGFGMRLREYSESIPKPMVNLGYRPVMWHLMKYYAHFGHKDFVLCLGYKADTVKNYFLHYDECLSNDFVLLNGGKKVRLRNSDIHDWRIAFVDTGTQSNIGQRLMAVKEYLQDDDLFLANYTDALTDLFLPEYLEHFQRSSKIGACLCVRPTQTFHAVSIKGELVRRIRHIRQSDIWMNAGFFIFRKEIFQYIRDGEELVEEPLQRLIAEEQLMAYKYGGFWKCMDTFKDKQELDVLCSRDKAPWEVWKPGKARSQLKVVAAMK